jgi:glyoxylase-like metal-dependent hydrolase (beta-lactamase superfamily II)
MRAGSFTVGALEIESRLTWGHSPGGMTFVINGLAFPVAIVGDSIFAGSMGGGNVSYEDAVQNNLKKILTLPNRPCFARTWPRDDRKRRKGTQRVFRRTHLIL